VIRPVRRSLLQISEPLDADQLEGEKAGLRSLLVRYKRELETLGDRYAIYGFSGPHNA
jgi:hypothetical protein